MTTLWPLVELVVIAGVWVLAIAYTAHCGRDTGILRKVSAFPGILLSACPPVAAVLYVIFRRRAPYYADICGTMGVLGLMLSLFIRFGRVIFGAQG